MDTYVQPYFHKAYRLIQEGLLFVAKPPGSKNVQFKVMEVGQAGIGCIADPPETEVLCETEPL